MKTFKDNNLEIQYLYPYSFVRKEIIALKLNNDPLILKKLIPLYLKWYLKLKFKKHIIICAPSFVECNVKKGFNHVEEIASWIGFNYLTPIEKLKDIKFAYLDKNFRNQVKNIFTLNHNFKNYLLQVPKILILDDVYTSGTTVKEIAQILKKKIKNIQISVLTLSISDFNI